MLQDGVKQKFHRDFSWHRSHTHIQHQPFYCLSRYTASYLQKVLSQDAADVKNIFKKTGFNVQPLGLRVTCCSRSDPYWSACMESFCKLVCERNRRTASHFKSLESIENGLKNATTHFGQRLLEFILKREGSSFLLTNGHMHFLTSRTFDCFIVT